MFSENLRFNSLELLRQKLRLEYQYTVKYTIDENKEIYQYGEFIFISTCVSYSINVFQ